MSENRTGRPLPLEIDDDLRKAWFRLIDDARGVLPSREAAQAVLPLALLGGLSREALVPPEPWESVLSASKETVQDEVLAALSAASNADPRLEGLEPDRSFHCVSSRQVKLLIEFVETWGPLRGWCTLFEDLVELGADKASAGAVEVVPRDLAQLLVELTKPSAADKVLDPRAGFGTMLVRASLFAADGSSEAVGYEVENQRRGLASAYAVLARCWNATLRGATSFLTAQNEKEREPYDTVLSCPPFGVRTGKELNERDFPYGTTSSGDLLALQDALLSLKPGGRAAVILPLVTLFGSSRDQAIRGALIEADLIEAVVQLGPGLWFNTAIPCCVVLGRGHGKKPEERRGRVLLVDASRRGEPGRSRSRLTPQDIAAIVEMTDGFVDVPGEAVVLEAKLLEGGGWNLAPRRYFAKERYEDLLRSRFSTLGSVPLGELFKIGRVERSEEAPPDATLYVRRQGRAPRATTDKPERPANWYRLDGTVPGLSPEYYVRFLNSEVGELGLSAESAGTTTALLPRSSLASLLVPAPDPAYQLRVLRAHRRIDEVLATAEELRDRVSNEPLHLEHVEDQLDAMDTGGSLERWTASLPYPLATVLRRYQTAVEPRDKQDFGVRFFEAAVQFVATYDLSCSHEAMTAMSLGPVGRLVPGLDRSRLLSASGIGSWLYLHAKLARVLQTREHEENLRMALDGRFVDILATLSNQQLTKLFRRAADRKNRLRSHDGVANRAEHMRQVSDIEADLQEFRRLTPGLFEKLRVVRPLSTVLTNGIREVTVEELRGSDPTFNRDIIISDQELDRSLLYAVVAGGTQALPFVPLVKMASRPEFAHDACYFFSRVTSEGVEWVSHHFDREGRFADDGGTLMATLDSLFPESKEE